MNSPKGLLGSQIAPEAVFREVNVESACMYVDSLEGCFVGVLQVLFQEASDLRNRLLTFCW